MSNSTLAPSNAQPVFRTTKIAGAVNRLFAIDTLRGIALILMGLDHAAYFAKTGIQAEHYSDVETHISTITHWGTGLLTNIATPTFWFVSGISIALFVMGRQRKGQTEWEISRYFFTRAVVIILLDQTIVALVWGNSFNVLSSLGVSLALMSVIRLLPIPLIAVMMSILIISYQWILTTFPIDFNSPYAFWQAIWLTYTNQTYPSVAFPVLGWGGLMGLGFVFGQFIQKPILQKSRTWLLMGSSLLIIWFIVRLNGGYGNLVPYDPNTPWQFFLFMSKSPPSLAYLLFNLGIAFCLMGLLYGVINQLEHIPLKWAVLAGQASLFFYVAHLVVYRGIGEPTAVVLPNGQFPGIVRGYMVWLMGLAILIPISAQYRNIRKRYPNSLLRYL